MSVAELVDRAARLPARVLLAGGERELLDSAAGRLAGAGMQGVSVVGDHGLRPDGHPRQQSVATLLRTRDPIRVRDGIHALDLAADPVRFALGLAALGDVEAVVTGPGVSAEELARAVAWVLGPAAEDGPRSSHWVMPREGPVVAFADCAFDGEPGKDGRARLARWASSLQGRFGEPPRVVFLSGLGEPDDDGPAQRAVTALRALDPGLVAEAAATPRYRGPGNVFIFPSGTAGHLAARSVRALSGARLLGPLLMVEPVAVAGVAEDADVDEVMGTAALAALAAGQAGT